MQRALVSTFLPETRAVLRKFRRLGWTIRSSETEVYEGR
jgi:hypothetical protein